MVTARNGRAYVIGTDVSGFTEDRQPEACELATGLARFTLE
jgi:hypothetical protein